MERLIALLLQIDIIPTASTPPSVWGAYGLVAFLSLFGVAKLFELGAKFFLNRQAKVDDAEVINRGKETDAKIDALKIITDRLKSVEARLDSMQDELRSHMETNARLSVENEFLKRENDRLTLEVGELRKDSLEKAGQVRILSDHLRAAEAKIESMLLKMAGLPQPIK